MLITDRRKCYALIGGVAFAVVLMTIQLGVFWGVTFQTSAFIRDLGSGELWVADPEVRFSHERRTLSSSMLARVRGVDGVEAAVALGHSLATLRLPDGTKSNVLLVGIDSDSLGYASVPLDEGSDWAALTNARNVLVDSVIADKRLRLKQQGDAKLEHGDFVEINNRERKVAGTFRARPSFFWEPTVLVNLSAMRELVGADGQAISYIQVRLQPDAEIEAVKQSIEASTGLKALTHAEFEAATVQYIFEETGILVNFAITVGLGFLIGTFVSAQTLYSFTLERLKYYGTLRAFGMPSKTLISIVMIHAACVGLLGYAIGVSVSMGLAFLLLSGGLAFAPPVGVLIAVAGATALMLLIGGYGSIRQVLKIEPASAFRST